jgi:proteasome accessory factor B
MASANKNETSPGDKTERLINLILALLSAKKFLTKSQIFDVVKVRGEAAYQGAIESKDRMFERDKDDLRGMGIHIEVGGLDPLFDDEAGYRIRESQYALQLPNLSPEELATLSIAATFWRDSAFSAEAQSALRRLHSLGVPADTTNIGLIDLRYEAGDANFDILNEAVTSRCTVTFKYAGQHISEKKVYPYGLILWNGFWYLLALDPSIDSIRMYKLSRIEGEVSRFGKSNAYEIPEGFSASQYVLAATADDQQLATLKIRNGTSLTLAMKGKEIGRDESWTTYQIPYDSQVAFARTCLWFGGDVEVVEPHSLRSYIQSTLAGILHG